MEIRIQIKVHVYLLTIGKLTEWFEQDCFISLAEEFYSHPTKDESELKDCRTICEI